MDESDEDGVGSDAGEVAVNKLVDFLPPSIENFRLTQLRTLEHMEVAFEGFVERHEEALLKLGRLWFKTGSGSENAIMFGERWAMRLDWMSRSLDTKGRKTQKKWRLAWLLSCSEGSRARNGVKMILITGSFRHRARSGSASY